MFKWGKKKEEPVEVYQTRAFHLERRQHARIRYPKCGALGDLPFMSYNGHELRPSNLSMGGILITEEVMSTLKAGDHTELVFEWINPPRKIVQSVEVIRVSSGGCHLRYLDLNPKLLVNLSLALKSGVRAQKTVKTESPVAPVLEAWKSASGEQLTFFSKENEAPEARISLPPKELHFNWKDGLRLGERSSDSADFVFERAAPKWLLHDLIVFLSNLPKSSPRVTSLLNELIKLL